MTPSEIAFLGIGLVLGAGIGAALAQVLRTRPSSKREVRLTITPNAIPASRTRTLSVPHATPHPGPIPGSPDADLPQVGRAATAGSAGPTPATASAYRTHVPNAPVTLPSSAVAIPVERSEPPSESVAARPGPGTVPGRPPSPAAPGPRSFTPGPQPPPTGPAAPPASNPGVPAARPDAGRGDTAEPSATLGGQGGPTDPRPTGRHPTVATPPDRQLTPVGPGHEGGAATGAVIATGLAVGVVAVAEAPADAPGMVTDDSHEELADDAGAVQDDATVASSREAFTMLVRPRASTTDTRPTLTAAAGVIADRPAVHRPVPTPQPALPPTRLAAPSEPTLTRPGAVAPQVRPRAVADGGDAGSSSTPGGDPAQPMGGPCDGPRRMVEERCALAGVAKDQARTAVDRLQEARRHYDVLRDQVERAAATADPRRVAAEKDRLHAAFRASTDRAGDPDETEAAARGWLNEINALNVAVREAARQAEQGTAELRAALPALERLSAEADAARIAAENAEAGCRDARQALAECDEAEQRRQPAPPPEEPHPFAHVWPVDRPELPDPGATPPPGEAMGGLPAIIRILRGDREARDRLIATLATDGDEIHDWQLRVSRLVDAIAARAIEDGYLDLPTDDPFWRLFEPREARDIVGALSALGFRYDGMGGFTDGRVPAARDLSLAVGYAGLDRMRIRTWPAEAGLAALYARAEVAADEWLSDQAGDLSLGRMVDALGGRAAELADVWNAWGRVRPALMAV